VSNEVAPSTPDTVQTSETASVHLLIFFGIALLVPGPKKLPELGRGIGKGIRGFKSAVAAKADWIAVRETGD